MALSYGAHVPTEQVRQMKADSSAHDLMGPVCLPGNGPPEALGSFRFKGKHNIFPTCVHQQEFCSEVASKNYFSI